MKRNEMQCNVYMCRDPSHNMLEITDFQLQCGQFITIKRGSPSPHTVWMVASAHPKHVWSKIDMADGWCMCILYYPMIPCLFVYLFLQSQATPALGSCVIFTDWLARFSFSFWRGKCHAFNQDAQPQSPINCFYCEARVPPGVYGGCWHAVSLSNCCAHAGHSRGQLMEHEPETRSTSIGAFPAANSQRAANDVPGSEKTTLLWLGYRFGSVVWNSGNALASYHYQ